jgi:hypothetical protein
VKHHQVDVGSGKEDAPAVSPEGHDGDAVVQLAGQLLDGAIDEIRSPASRPPSVMAR